MASFKPAAILAVALTIAAAASPALAQTTEAPDVSSLPVRLGPFYIAPALALTNVGVDTNVFNEADDQLPKEDFTVTLTPKANVWLRLGGTWLNAATQEDLVWYRKYTSENSANNVTRVNWLVPLTRFTFAVGGESVHTKERPGFEIDARVPRTEGDLNGAVEISVLSKTHVGVRADRRTTDFKDVTYLDVNLQNELNRTSTTGAVTVRNELTPLTNLTLDFSRQEDRFEFDPLRDSNSTQVAVGLKFNQLALLKGGVQFGIRDFSPVSAGIPGFTGLTSAVDLTYVLLGSTRLSFGTTRDVQYRYDTSQPYYVQTNVSGTITQQIFGPVDVQGRIGTAWLAYRTRAGAVQADEDRVDRTHTYGVGLGYHMGPTVRLGINVDENKRESVVEGHTYHDLRYGVGLTYGF